MAVLNTKSCISPYTLRYKVIDNSFDELGNPIESGVQWSKDIKCDAVPSGKANERTFEDGVKRAYSYTIYLNHDCPDFVLGQTIELRQRGSNKSKEYQVLGFIRYQLQAKLWV